ncbi:MAG: MFS transporter [Clostridia bacterium]|nr:MFS transporter [Clostridia bacterium]
MNERVFSKDYVLCFLSTFLVYASVYSLVPILPLYLEAAGKNRSEIGLIIGTLSAACLVVVPLAGRLSDRVPPKRLMLFGTVLLVLAPVLYLVSTATMTLVPARFVHGLGLATYLSAAMVTVTGLVPRSRLAQATGIFAVSISLGIGLGPSAGSFLMTFWSFPQEMAFTSVLAAAALMLTLCLGRCPVQPGTERAAFTTVLRDRNILLPTLVMLTASFTVGVVTAFLPLHVHSWSAHGAGLFFLAYSGTTTIVRLVAGGLSDRYGRKAVVVPSLVAVGAGILLLAPVETTKGLVAIAMLYGAGMSFVYPTLSALVVERTAAGSRGTALGIFAAAAESGFFLGPTLMGCVAQYRELHDVFLFSAIIPVVGILICTLIPHAPATGRPVDQKAAAG